MRSNYAYNTLADNTCLAISICHAAARNVNDHDFVVVAFIQQL